MKRHNHRDLEALNRRLELQLLEDDALDIPDDDIYAVISAGGELATGVRERLMDADDADSLAAMRGYLH